MARYATTDIHGCLLSLRHLLEEKIKLKPQDELYVLGDYVNKGPDSRGVLDYLMQLHQRGYQIVCLRGNHDHDLLRAAQGEITLTWGSVDDYRLTLDSFGVERPEDIPERYLRWINDLPYQFDIPGFMLVHAGYDFRQPPAEMRQQWHTMLNIKEFVFDASRTGGRRVVHGHVPTPTSEVEAQVKAQKGSIGLDTGCVYRHNPELHHLAALDLDANKLYLQPNIEPDYPIGMRY
ncbi:metallophosphoesterase family protein [Hymenobacter sp. DG01]|uniref:metallophosphoesterase family protein n=1 Tax=Hymenobacter sp. DG01 TaxID=2584940 RepID=UPI0011230142|nr:metallophosphoesterase family protein [Hymenobacter sp. DG01]